MKISRLFNGTAAATLLLFITSTLTTAQTEAPREKVTQSLEWLGVTSNIKVHKHVNLILEGQFRFVRALDPMQFQMRTAVDVQVNKDFSFVPVGYVYTWNPIYGKQPNTYVNNEHRIWHQVMYKHHAGKFAVSHRLRMEERYIQVHTNTNGQVVDQGYQYTSQRLRYRLMVNRPIGKDKIEPKTYYASFYDEAFISWGPKVTYNEPDQNRLFLGMGYQVTKDFGIQAGGLYQMLVKANGAKQENNIGLQVMMTYNFDLTNN